MLSLMCRAFWDGHLTSSTSRLELYERCLEGLLGVWRVERRDAMEIDKHAIQNQLQLLACTGLALYEQRLEKFDRSQLLDALSRCVEKKEAEGQLPKSEAGRAVRNPFRPEGRGSALVSASDLPSVPDREKGPEGPRERPRLAIDPQAGWTGIAGCRPGRK